jgi:2-amino-4-hydroxy-6-hydroxymethyldihydropteridine diphosphokinase
VSRAVLSIGGNLGDTASTLRSAVEAMRPWLVAVSPVYRTPPWGPVEQGEFLNAVIIVDDPAASARDWLDRAHAAERGAGRVRDVRWGPRTLDVDVVDVDGATSDDPELILPHPRARQRAFVLVPWLAADPGATLDSAPVGELIATLPPDEVDGVQVVDEVRLG